jgi:peptidoglycan/xylan/chitin deacetylase (PgdA/CDA1 family)
MKPTVALLYHDVVRDGNFTSSGFQGGDSDIYKLDAGQFRRHVDAITKESSRVLITVDDGGVSALQTIAPLLEAKQLHGYFFITTNWIGRPGFLSRDQIGELRQRGHLIGSHSCSHPERISHCSWEEMCDEWKRSTDVLSTILGESIQMASVPGGFYSRKVAQAAATAGIRTLFTSDPTTSVACVNGCVVAGRFMIQRSTSPELAAALARAAVVPRLKQSVSWNAKKVLKAAGGTAWLRFRKWALK